jgi:O-antigen/teichoic acid export membrane protein
LTRRSTTKPQGHLKYKAAAHFVGAIFSRLKALFIEPSSVAHRHVLALMDQGIVSCANFLATIAVGRWGDASQLGDYSIGFSIVLLLLGTQGSLITQPYTIQQHSGLGTSRERAGSSLTQSAMLACLTSAILIAVGNLRSLVGNSGFAELLLALAGAAPFLLLREFSRQLAFARFRLWEAVVLDAAVVVLQLAALAWLGWTGRMTSANACISLGVGAAFIVVPSLYASRREFAVHPKRTLEIAAKNWALAKWLFAGQVTGLVQRLAVYWLLATLVGAAATGVFSACMSVGAFANPFIIGLSNIFMPKAVLAFNHGGESRLVRQTVQDALLLGAVMGSFCILIAFEGGNLLKLLYHGHDYDGQGFTTTLITLASLPFVLGVPAAIGLASMERPRMIVWAGVLGIATTIGLVFLLAPKWGPAGAACAVFAGNAAEAAARWASFLVYVTRRNPIRGAIAPTNVS